MPTHIGHHLNTAEAQMNEYKLSITTTEIEIKDNDIIGIGAKLLHGM